MTCLAILSDIHGNLPALETALADVATFPVDHIVVAGDVVNWGPWSAAALARVVDEGWPVIRGNNEFYALDYGTPRAPEAWRNADQWAMLPWLHRQLDTRARATLATWPDTLSLRFADAPPLRIVHGSPRSAWESILPDITEAEAELALGGVEEATLVAAHTHLPMDRQVGRWHIINPGSVGVPLHGRHEATYMLMEGTPDGWRATQRRLPLDPTPVLAEFERQGFGEECGVIGALVMDEFRYARMEVPPFLNWRRETCPDTPLRPALLERYRKADWRLYCPVPYIAAIDASATETPP